jgi:hypothetical protein
MAKPIPTPIPPQPDAPPPKKTKGKQSRFQKMVATPPKKPLIPPPPPVVAPPLVADLQPEAVLGEGTQKDIIDNLFNRAFDRWTKREEANQGVGAIAEIVSFIQSGRSLRELEAKLIPLLSEQQAKTNILQAAMYNHQMERIALHWENRWILERDLWMDLREQKLTPREKLALLAFSTKEAKDAAAYINGANVEFRPMKEVEPTIEQAGKHSASKVISDKKKEFEGTTPQGREIIRRMTFKAKVAADQIVDKELAKEAKPDGGKPQ